jgi:hypothetical protein
MTVYHLVGNILWVKIGDAEWRIATAEESLAYRNPTAGYCTSHTS